MALFRIRPPGPTSKSPNRFRIVPSPEVEQIAEALTWGADEHVMCALAAGWWLYCRRRSPRHRADSNHILLTTVAVTLLPHFLKSIFDQERPDRLMVRGHLHGVPFSESALDAFPSGHAIHVGALASAATVLPPAKRNLVWSIGAGLVLTRIVLLAHWTSDVIAGLAIGAWSSGCSGVGRVSDCPTGNSWTPRHPCKQIRRRLPKDISTARGLLVLRPRPRS